MCSINQTPNVAAIDDDDGDDDDDDVNKHQFVHLLLYQKTENIHFIKDIVFIRNSCDVQTLRLFSISTTPLV